MTAGTLRRIRIWILMTLTLTKSIPTQGRRSTNVASIYPRIPGQNVLDRRWTETACLTKQSSLQERPIKALALLRLIPLVRTSTMEGESEGRHCTHNHNGQWRHHRNGMVPNHSGRKDMPGVQDQDHRQEWSSREGFDHIRSAGQCSSC